jgi:hypothetical protein
MDLKGMFIKQFAEFQLGGIRGLLLAAGDASRTIRKQSTAMMLRHNADSITQIDQQRIMV